MIPTRWCGRFWRKRAAVWRGIPYASSGKWKKQEALRPLYGIRDIAWWEQELRAEGWEGMSLPTLQRQRCQKMIGLSASKDNGSEYRSPHMPSAAGEIGHIYHCAASGDGHFGEGRDGHPAGCIIDVHGHG